MSYFNSIGSNYAPATSWQALFGQGTHGPERLQTALEHRYGGTATLLYKGREAISLALNRLQLGKGSLVGITGYTCFAVYQAVIEAGCLPVFLDIDPENLNFSAATLRQCLTNHTIKAVIIQNSLGFACDIKAIAKLCDEHKIVLIEDLAHSIGAVYADKREAGTVGSLVVLSFGRDKLIDAVAGGALIDRSHQVAPESLALRPAAFLARWRDRIYPILTALVRSSYGTGLGKLFHVGFKRVGLLSQSVDSEFYGATALAGWCAQLGADGFRDLDKNLAHRRQIAQIYSDNIDRSLLFDQLTKVIKTSANLRFPLRVKNRSSLWQYLKTKQIHITDTWYDAPIAPLRYLASTNYDHQCPNAELVAAEMVNLPTHRAISPDSAKMISNEINRWLALQ